MYWREPVGRQRNKPLGSTRKVKPHEAQLACVAKQIELGQRASIAPCATFEEWVEDYLVWHDNAYPSSPFRIRQLVRQWLVPLSGTVELRRLKTSSVEKYCMARNAAPGTVSKELRTLHTRLNKALEWEIIERNPVKDVRPPKDLDDAPPRCFTESELRALY